MDDKDKSKKANDEKSIEETEDVVRDKNGKPRFRTEELSHTMKPSKKSDKNSEKKYVVNLKKLAEIFDMDYERVKYIHKYGVECDECGEYLKNFGEAIKHEHSITKGEIE